MSRLLSVIPLFLFFFCALPAHVFAVDAPDWIEPQRAREIDYSQLPEFPYVCGKYTQNSFLYGWQDYPPNGENKSYQHYECKHEPWGSSGQIALMVQFSQMICTQHAENGVATWPCEPVWYGPWEAWYIYDPIYIDKATCNTAPYLHAEDTNGDKQPDRCWRCPAADRERDDFDTISDGVRFYKLGACPTDLAVTNCKAGPMTNSSSSPVSCATGTQRTLDIDYQGAGQTPALSRPYSTGR